MPTQTIHLNSRLYMTACFTKWAAFNKMQDVVFAHILWNKIIVNCTLNDLE